MGLRPHYYLSTPSLTFLLDMKDTDGIQTCHEKVNKTSTKLQTQKRP